MKKGTTPLIVGNWKMNPKEVRLAEKLGKELKRSLSARVDASIVLAPPVIYLETLSRLFAGNKKISLAVQDIFFEESGAHTGETSLSMVASFGADYVIIGHSERRALGESDEIVNKKLHATLRAHCTGIICVGEKTRDMQGHYLTHIETQIQHALAKVTRNKLERVVIAYEPIWAIGTGNNATEDLIHEMTLFIRKILSDMYERNYADKIRILYGGSVNEKNAFSIFHEGMVDGFLVGGASLDAEKFNEIVKATQAV